MSPFPLLLCLLLFCVMTQGLEYNYTLSPLSHQTYQDTGVHTYNLSMWKTERASRVRDQGQSEQYREFQISQCYIVRLYFK